MAARGEYCPYEVVPLARRVDGTEFDVQTAFGRMHCLRSGTLAGGNATLGLGSTGRGSAGRDSAGRDSAGSGSAGRDPDGRESTGSPGAASTVATEATHHGDVPGRRRGTVFVHGVHDDMDSWGPLVHAAKCSGVDLGPALFVDLPGFGKSENRRDKLDLAEVADAVMDVALVEMGFDSLRLVGHSMGTLVVADLATRRPDRVESVHLAAGPYYSIVDSMNGRPSGGLSGGLATVTFATQYLLALTGAVGVGAVELASRAGLLRPLLSPFAAHPRLLRQSVLDNLIGDMRPASFRSAARNGFHYPNGMSWSGVHCPVWAAYGAADRLVPASDARRLRADLPDARITTVPEAAHLLHLEQPLAALVALGLH